MEIETWSFQMQVNLLQIVTPTLYPLDGEALHLVAHRSPMEIETWSFQMQINLPQMVV